MWRVSRSPITASPEVIMEVVGFRLLTRPSFLRSYVWRCEAALAVIILITSGEVWSKEGVGGEQLMVMSAPIVE